MLLAKVVSDDLGFIIFDDIVNAIDDDHRSGIACLLLECPDIKDRQQIITCHGEEFINKLSHKLGVSEVSKQVKNYKFLPADCVNERGIIISLGDSKHYLARADETFQSNNLKDSLSYCRKAVESLSTQLWKKLGRVLSINLSVKMRQANSKPDLSSVVNGLNNEIKKITLEPESMLKDNIKTLLEQYNWALLNKGTHEEDELPEFEREDVNKLIALLNKIEHEILALQVKVTATTCSKTPELRGVRRVEANLLIEKEEGENENLVQPDKNSFKYRDNVSTRDKDSIKNSRISDPKVIQAALDLVKNKAEQFDVIDYLVGQGLEVADKRPNGGALWVLGGMELTEMMKEVDKKGYSFTYLENGGKATKKRSAWYCSKKKVNLA